MIRYPSWQRARDLVKEQQNFSLFHRNRLNEIDKAIRSGNEAATLKAIARFKQQHSDDKYATIYGDLIEWLEAHLGDFGESDPSRSELDDIRYQLHPYILPSTWNLSLSNESRQAWKKSRDSSASWHTFIGVTHKVTGASAIYPCFMEDSSRQHVFNPAIKNCATATDYIEQKVMTGGNPMAPKFEIRRLPKAVKVTGTDNATRQSIVDFYGSHAIIQPYQQSNFIVTESKGELSLTWSLDGMYHKEACRQERDAETSFIGWSIKGSGSKIMGTIRFVSGRNLGKFRSEFREAGHEARDMPMVYAEAIAKMCQRELQIQLDDEVSMQTSGRGKAARHWFFRTS